MRQKLTIILIAFSLLFLPFFASARGLVPCGGYDPALAGGREKPCDIEDIFVIIARVTNFLIAMAGVFAVYEIIRAGFWLILAMGNEETITKEKGAIQSAIIGLILVMMAFMFINTVVNFMLGRSTATNNGTNKCKFDLTSPLTYISMDPNNCAATK